MLLCLSMMGRQRFKAISLATLFVALVHSPFVWGAGARQAPAQEVAARQVPIIRRVLDSARSGKKLPKHWKIAGNDYVSVSEYRNLRDGCMEILRQYPPDKYYFVGLGRDPAPVIAFLQNLGEKELAVNLPGTSNIQWAQNGLKPVDVARHVEAAIPEHILAGDRTIVLLDVTSSGKTPAIFGPFMDRYLRRRGQKTKAVRLALSWSNVLQGQHSGAGLKWIDTSAWPDFTEYYSGKYEGSWTPEEGGEGIAEHQRHEMGRGVKPPRATNPNYTKFRKALLARMAADRLLDQFLTKSVNLEAMSTVPPVTRKPTTAWMPQFRALKVAQKALGEGPLLKLDVSEVPDLKESTDRWVRYLSQSDYTEFRTAALELMERFRPDKHFYIGVGRSSSPLVAFLENLGDGVATYLPVDGLRKYISHGATAGTLPPQKKAAFFRLFDAFLPEEVLLGDRNIVLFQQSNSGASLPFVRDLLTEYFAQRGSETQATIVAFTAQPLTIPSIDVAQSNELTQMKTAKYFAIAPYPYFRPGGKHHALTDVMDENGTPNDQSKNFQRFKRAMQKRMNQDSSLQEAIGKFVAAIGEEHAAQ